MMMSDRRVHWESEAAPGTGLVWICTTCDGRIESGARYLHVVEVGGSLPAAADAPQRRYCIFCAPVGIRRMRLKLDADRQVLKEYIEQAEERLATFEQELSDAQEDAELRTHV